MYLKHCPTISENIAITPTFPSAVKTVQVRTLSGFRAQVDAWMICYLKIE